MQHSALSPPCGSWSEPALRARRRLNALTLTRMRELALAGLPTAAAVSAQRERWCALEPAALERLSDCPFLLIEPGLPRTPAAGLCWPERFPLPHRERLASSLIVFLWQLAHESPALAGTVSEATPAELAALAALDSGEVAALAETLAPELRPRWAERPEVWRALLVHAAAEDEDARLALVARGLQLLAGERLRARTAERRSAPVH